MTAVRSGAAVLLTGAGGAAAVSFMKAVAGQPVVIHAGDMDPLAAGLYLVPAARRHRLPPGASAEFVPHLFELCRRHAIDVLVPTVDVELLPLARARHQFKAAGIDLLLAPEDALARCVDKLTLLQCCDGAVPVGRYAPLDETFSADGWEFPLMVKPRRGSGSRGIEMVLTADRLADLSRHADLLVQEYLPGEEYSVDVLAGGDGRIVATVPRLRMKVDSGVAVAAMTLHDALLEGIASRVAERIGLHYVANIQLRRDIAGTPTLLEVNPRFPGTMPLTVRSGVNMPLLALQDVLGTPLPDGPLPFEEIAVVRYWTEEFIDPAEISALGPEVVPP